MTINLLPQQHKQEKQFISFINEVFFGIFAIFIFIVIVEILFYAYNSKLETKLSDANNKISALNSEITKSNDLSTKLSKLQIRSVAMDKLKNSPAPQSQILALINHAAADSIQINSVTSDTENDLVVITGIAKSTDVLNTMQSVLETDAMVQAVSLSVASADSAGLYAFATKITLEKK